MGDGRPCPERLDERLRRRCLTEQDVLGTVGIGAEAPGAVSSEQRVLRDLRGLRGDRDLGVRQVLDGVQRGVLFDVRGERVVAGRGGSGGVG